MSTFYVPAINLIGRGVVKEIGPYVKDLGYHKALLVTDKFIESSDILPKVTEPLKEAGVDFVVYSDVEPNPTCKNVNDGVAAVNAAGLDTINSGSFTEIKARLFLSTITILTFLSSSVIT